MLGWTIPLIRHYGRSVQMRSSVNNSNRKVSESRTISNLVTHEDEQREMSRGEKDVEKEKGRGRRAQIVRRSSLRPDPESNSSARRTGVRSTICPSANISLSDNQRRWIEILHESPIPETHRYFIGSFSATTRYSAAL